MASRQREWQIRQKQKGLCRKCGESIFRSDLCKTHYQRDLRRRKASGKRKPYACSICNKTDHNRRRCPDRDD